MRRRRASNALTVQTRHVTMFSKAAAWRIVYQIQEHVTDGRVD
jgi:hypothetical protein